MPLSGRDEIIAIIESAFDGVILDGGISLEQAKVLDNYGEGVSSRQFAALPTNEVVDDWRAVPDSELDRAEYTAHLDAKGFRYYIPALMLRLLDNYDPPLHDDYRHAFFALSQAAEYRAARISIFTFDGRSKTGDRSVYGSPANTRRTMGRR